MGSGPVAEGRPCGTFHLPRPRGADLALYRARPGVGRAECAGPGMRKGRAGGSPKSSCPGVRVDTCRERAAGEGPSAGPPPPAPHTGRDDRLGGRGKCGAAGRGVTPARSSVEGGG